MENVAAPDPVERRARGVDLCGVALAKLEARRREPVADERAGRLDALGRRFDADDVSLGPDRLGQPEREQPDTAADVEAARALGQAEVRDDRPRFRLLKSVHPLQRLREGFGIRLCHRSSFLGTVLAAASARSVYLASVRSATAVGPVSIV